MRPIFASLLLLILANVLPASADDHTTSAVFTAVPEILIVDINTASAEEMATKLVGIGLIKARAIVAYRDEFGPFQVVEQLTEVDGIGERTLELNRERLRLGEDIE